MTLQIVTERQDSGEFRYRCARSKDGRNPTLIGCRHLSPRSADDHTRQLAAPLPAPAMGSDVNTPVPLRAAGVELIAGSAIGTAGPARTG